jgi:hypothetical protein
VPVGISGRVYMAFGEKLKFFLTPDGLVQPAPWAPQDANRNILFEKDGKAYGFAFDDVGHFESLVHDAAPKSATITLTAF